MTAPADPVTPPIEESVMPEITDEYMQEMLGKSNTYTAMLLKLTEKAGEPDALKVIWEHGRRNFELRANGKLPIVCPATDESDWAGIGISTPRQRKSNGSWWTTQQSRRACSPTNCIPSAASPPPASHSRPWIKRQRAQ